MTIRNDQNAKVISERSLRSYHLPNMDLPKDSKLLVKPPIAQTSPKATSLVAESLENLRKSSHLLLNEKPYIENIPNDGFRSQLTEILHRIHQTISIIERNAIDLSDVERDTLAKGFSRIEQMLTTRRNPSIDNDLPSDAAFQNQFLSLVLLDTQKLLDESLESNEKQNLLLRNQCLLANSAYALNAFHFLIAKNTLDCFFKLVETDPRYQQKIKDVNPRPKFIGQRSALANETVGFFACKTNKQLYEVPGLASAKIQWIYEWFEEQNLPCLMNIVPKNIYRLESQAHLNPEWPALKHLFPEGFLKEFQ